MTVPAPPLEDPGYIAEAEYLLGTSEAVEAPYCNDEKIGRDLAIDLASLRLSEIPLAVDHLDAVIQTTECAASHILDACNALEAIGRETGGEVGEAVDRAVTAIYEACSFQDLTGQRIVKVANTLGVIDGKLGEVTLMVGLYENEIAQQAVAASAAEGPGEAQLLGPQRPENAIEQADVDRLLAQLS